MKLEKKIPLKNIILIFLSTLVVPVVVFLLSYFFGVDHNQGFIIGFIILTIIWWSSRLVNQVFASLMLLLVFVLFTNISLKMIFAFPLSESFLLIIFSYLFSQGISNSKITSKIFNKLFLRYADTPIKVMGLSIVILVLTIIVIPQPLVRLIIVSDILNNYLSKTDSSLSLRRILLLSLFIFYIFINMTALQADIILNPIIFQVADIEMTNISWISYMAIPSICYLALVFLTISLIFHKEIFNVKFSMKRGDINEINNIYLNENDKKILFFISITVFLWMTEPFHGVSSWLIALISVLVMLIKGILSFQDLKKIDISMLVFLTAALAIGSVIRMSEITDIIFGSMNGLLPRDSLVYTIFIVMGITIPMHMIIGSGTSTLSVVIPSILNLCNGTYSNIVIVFVIYVTVAAQWLLPIHSVGLMLGTSKKYFSVGDLIKIAIPLSFLIFFAIFAIYLPWWKLIGLL